MSKSMSQREFYELPEVVNQLNIQKTNPYGSEKHKTAYDKVGEIAKKHGVYDRYKKSGAGEY